MSNKSITNIIRLGFFGWWLFELLNWMQVLHFSLDFTWYGLWITVTWIWGIIEFISWRLRRSGLDPFPWPVYLVGLFGTSFDAFGDVAHLYSRISYYDKYAHFFGGAAGAILLLFLFRRMQQSGKLSLPPVLLGFLAISAGNMLGIVYEIEEYSESLLLHNNRMGDAFDTSTDILFNILGAVFIVVLTQIILKRMSIGVKNLPSDNS